MAQVESWIEDYLEYQKETEPPIIYHRWSALSGIGALLGKNAWVQHGHGRVYGNMYVMLVGESGARKDTAIKGIKKLLRAADYNTIAANKSSKEKLLLDMESGLDNLHEEDEDLDVTKNAKNPTMRALFGKEVSTEPSECFIMAGELNAFLGHSNIDFIDLLTDLWDFDDPKPYTSRIKTGKSVSVCNPTISMLCGNTSVGISQAFPIEVIGQGFFSRLISVYSDPSGRRISFPPPPPAELTQNLVERLLKIRNEFKGPVGLEPVAYMALDEIYQNWIGLEDVRFKSYSSRRFSHLLKTCLILAADRFQKTITKEIVVMANTIMHYTEHFMPKALGEFGKARNSDVSAKVLSLLETTDKPLHIIGDIWPLVRRDLDSQKALVDLVIGLRSAGKIQETANGILIKKEKPSWDKPHTNVLLLKEYLDQRAREGLPI